MRVDNPCADVEVAKSGGCCNLGRGRCEGMSWSMSWLGAGVEVAAHEAAGA
jgi:hypothetical protein